MSEGPAVLDVSAAQPAGPVYVSVPLDDWNEQALPADSLLTQRSVRTAGVLSEEIAAELVSAVDGARSVALVLGPQVDAAAAADPSVWDAVNRTARSARLVIHKDS